MERGAYRTFLGWACVIAAGYLMQPYRAVIVRGNSMTPTYHNFQLLIASPLQRPPKDGDVVLVAKDGATLIKRISMISGDPYTQLYLPHTGEWVTVRTEAALNIAAKGLAPSRVEQVPAGKMYITGDNASVSYDSRMFGFVDTSSIKGIVVASL